MIPFEALGFAGDSQSSQPCQYQKRLPLRVWSFFEDLCKDFEIDILLAIFVGSDSCGHTDEGISSDQPVFDRLLEDLPTKPCPSFDRIDRQRLRFFAFFGLVPFVGVFKPFSKLLRVDRGNALERSPWEVFDQSLSSVLVEDPSRVFNVGFARVEVFA